MKLIKQLNEQAEMIDQLEAIDIAGKRLRKQALAYLRSLVHASKYKIETARRRQAIAQRRQDPEKEVVAGWAPTLSVKYQRERLNQYRKAYQENPELGDLGQKLHSLDSSAYRKLSQGYGGDLSNPRILKLLRELT